MNLPTHGESTAPSVPGQAELAQGGCGSWPRPAAATTLGEFCLPGYRRSRALPMGREVHPAWGLDSWPRRRRGGACSDLTSLALVTTLEVGEEFSHVGWDVGEGGGGVVADGQDRRAQGAQGG